MAALLYGCGVQENKQNGETAVECPPCQISEKCLALLAYGLLSNDENDIPLGGACKDIISDSLVDFLVLQKRLFKHWQRTGEYDTSYHQFARDYQGDLSLLHSLIFVRALTDRDLGDKSSSINASNMKFKYGSDYSFIWRLYILGISYREAFMLSFRPLDIRLDPTASFNDFTAYLDSAFLYRPEQQHFGAVPNWCKTAEIYILELKIYSKKDFFVKYYNLRCKNENSLDFE
jgi:hypothetical protein